MKAGITQQFRLGVSIQAMSLLLTNLTHLFYASIF
jgi:hypothetical protein